MVVQMNDKPTVKEVGDALNELEVLMGVAHDNPGVLETLTALYAKGYCLKLRLMAKESKHVGH